MAYYIKLFNDMCIRGLSWWLRWKRIYLQCGRPGFDPLVRKIPWRRAWQPTPVFLPRESHGQRSLAGYSPWGCTESDTTEMTKQQQQLVVVLLLGFPGDSDGKESTCNAGDPGLIPWSGRSPGEGNGNPLQYYCLENPMDRGAW